VEAHTVGNVQYKDNRLTDGGEITLRTGRSIPWEESSYSFLLEAESTQGYSAAGSISWIENPMTLSGIKPEALGL
jgi:hypothetical protein